MGEGEPLDTNYVHIVGYRLGDDRDSKGTLRDSSQGSKTKPEREAGTGCSGPIPPWGGCHATKSLQGLKLVAGHPVVVGGEAGTVLTCSAPAAAFIATTKPTTTVSQPGRHEAALRLIATSCLLLCTEREVPRRHRLGTARVHQDSRRKAQAG
jgi:hypothetical protein